MTRRIATFLAAGALALGLGACGGDDEEPSAATSTEVPAPGATGPAGAAVTADDLIACLSAAGYEAIEGNEILGMEGDYTPVQFPLGDLEQGAAFIVYPDEATAEAEEDVASALIGVSPSERSGNVIWGFDAAVDEAPDDVSAVEGCLP